MSSGDFHAALDLIQGVAHRLRRHRGIHLNAHGIAQRLLDKGVQIFGEGGGEEQGLPFGGQMVENFLNGRQKSHVQHAIRFIQHQAVQLAKIGVAAFDVIEQAAGAGDDEFHAVAQRARLLLHGDPAVDGDGAHVGMDAQFAHHGENLLHQFAGGGENHRAGAAGFRGRRDELLQDGQHKGCRFSGAGLRRAHQIAPGHRHRQRRGLNGRRRDKSGRDECALQPVIQGKFGK